MAKQKQKNPVAVKIAQQFSGPIPPPQILERYEDIVPGSAERILKMAENQADHRQAIEKRIVNSSVVNERLGLFFGFTIGLVAIGAGVFCIFNGYSLPGSFIGTGGIIGLVTVFIIGSKPKKK